MSRGTSAGRLGHEAQSWSAAHGSADWEARVGNWRRYSRPEQAQRVLEVTAAAGVPDHALDGLPSRELGDAARARGWHVHAWEVDRSGGSPGRSQGPHAASGELS